MKVVPFGFDNELFHLFVYGWCMERFGKYSKDILSDFGFMVVNEEKPLLAMFFYPTVGSSMAMLGWPVSPKSTIKSERDLAVPIVLKHIEDYAKDNGYKLLATFPGSEVMHQRLTDAGFKVGDDKVVHFYKELGV